MTAFDEFDGDWFIVKFGNKEKTIHRSFLISWQYRVLKQFIKREAIYAAERMVDGPGKDESILPDVE